MAQNQSNDHEKLLQELKTAIQEQDRRLQNLQSSAFQLANYYFVFQGVILTAIYNGQSSIKCSDRWILFTVSLLAALLNLIALCLIVLKYMRSIAQQDHNWYECNELERISKTCDPTNISATSAQSSDPYKQLRRYFVFGVCMSVFLGFAGVMLTGCWHIICRESETKNDECIKLCDGDKCLRICRDY